MSQTIDFDLVQDFVKLDGEGNRDASPAAMLVLRGLILRFTVVIERVIMVLMNDKVTIVVLCSLPGLLGLATTLRARLLLVDANILFSGGNLLGDERSLRRDDRSRSKASQKKLRQRSLAQRDLCCI